MAPSPWIIRPRPIVVIVGHENKPVFRIEFSFESVHGKTVNVLVQGLAFTHVFRWNADGIFLGYYFVHVSTSSTSQKGAGRTDVM